MAIIKNNFFEQVSLASIKKRANKLSAGRSLEFWETEIEFKHNKSDFKFNVTEPEKNLVTNKIIDEWEVNDSETNYKCELVFEKDLKRRGNVKRFWTKEEAETYILFNIIQIYKPLKNYVDDNDIVDRFNTLLDEHPELFVRELSTGKSWLSN